MSGAPTAAPPLAHPGGRNILFRTDFRLPRRSTVDLQEVGDAGADEVADAAEGFGI